MTPSRSNPRERSPEAIVSEKEKNPWAAGWEINFLTRMMMVITLAMKLMPPRMMYKVARFIGIFRLKASYSFTTD